MTVADRHCEPGLLRDHMLWLDLASVSEKDGNAAEGKARAQPFPLNKEKGAKDGRASAREYC